MCSYVWTVQTIQRWDNKLLINVDKNSPGLPLCLFINSPAGNVDCVSMLYLYDHVLWRYLIVYHVDGKQRSAGKGKLR